MKRAQLIRILFKTIMFIFIGCGAAAQDRMSYKCTFEVDSLFNKIAYTSADSMPKFQNGTVSILKYFKLRFRVPEGIDYFQGSFTSVFVIDTDGCLKAARIKGKSENQLTELEKQVLKIYRNMPRWKVGKCKGKTVPVIMTLNFKL